MDHEQLKDMAKTHNILSLMANRSTEFLSVVFRGKNGFYYDPVGNEIFHVTKISEGIQGAIYKIDHGDQVQVGLIKDHGFNEYLGD